MESNKNKNKNTKLSKETFDIVKELNTDRKYDSYIDEYRRYLSTGCTIVLPINVNNAEIFDYAFKLFLKSIDKSITKNDIFPKKTLGSSKNKKTFVKNYVPGQHFSVEILSKEGTVKRITIENAGKTIIRKFPRLDYFVFYKATRTQFGLAAMYNKHLIRKKERIIAASLAKKMASKFNVKPPDWAIMALRKHEKKENYLF